MNVLDTHEGRVLVLSSVTTLQAVDLLDRNRDDPRMNQLCLLRLEINGQLIPCLSRVLKVDDRTWLSLKLVDCLVGALDEKEEQEFLDTVSHFEQLFLQTTHNTQNTSQCSLPVRGASQVSTLRLCINNFDESLARMLVQCLSTTSTLSEVCLSGSRRCGVQVAILAEALRANKSLEKLDLGDCQLNDDNLFVLLSALRGHPKLKQLDVSNNGMSDRALEALVDTISHPDSHLESVDLGLQRRSLNVALLAPVIAQNPPFLKRLYLANCGLVDTKVFPLIDALTLNTRLETLDLSKNRQLTDNFLIYLGHRLPRMHLTTLNVLHLHHASGSPAAMRAMSEGLRQNTHMELLRLLFWKELMAARWIQVYINLNRGGRRALEEKIPLTLWPLILERAQKCRYFCPLLVQSNAKDDSIFYLLRNEPALWQQNFTQ